MLVFLSMLTLLSMKWSKWAPVIEIGSWKDIKQNVKTSIAIDILVCTMTFVLLIILNL
jgi:hypothetical protein